MRLFCRLYPRSDEDPFFEVNGTMEDVKLEISEIWDVAMENLKTTSYSEVAQSRLGDGYVVWEVFERRPAIRYINARGEVIKSGQRAERTVKYIWMK